MIRILTDPLWMLVGVPVVGAALGLLLWSKPGMLKVWALLVSMASLLLLMGMSGRLSGPVEGMALLYLLPVAAFLSLLGQPVHQVARVPWVMTLLLLGVGLGAIVSQDQPGVIFLPSVLGLVGLLVHRYRTSTRSQLIWGIGTYSLGMGCLFVSLVAASPISSVALLLTYAILLPLFPFHGGYVAALAGLPGNLPVFLALLLPSIGFHGLLTLLPDTPGGVVQALVILALFGALYGSLKALVQCKVIDLLAYASTAFFAILWWYLALTRGYTPQAAVYLSAVALVTAGLLLAWRAVQVRYGDVDLSAISGLARSMPRFAAGLALLVLAAMGLPPFGLFSGFIGMLLDPSLALSGTLLVILIAWLTASWYFLDLMQRILFGRPRPDIRYEDLRHTEIASLLMILMILLSIGVAPSRFFEPGMPDPAYRTAMESDPWSK